MAEPNSLAMACPAARKPVCDSLMEALGRGPNTFSVPLVLKGSTSVSAYGAHTYDDELATALSTQKLPPGVTLADLQAHGFTADTARTTIGYIRFRVVASRRSIENFKARLDQDGVETLPVATP